MATGPRGGTRAGLTESRLLSAPRALLRTEVWLAGATLALAAGLRLVLAATGWPALDSDEATMGLMADDILRKGAHPIFFYGQNYLGALQAYLAAPIFAWLGPTVFALRVTATLQVCVALISLYAFTRAVFSPAVALWTLVLLALGPAEALHLELHAGAGGQETMLFGALLLLLVYQRVRMPPRPAIRLLFDFGIGVAAGLGFWSDLLIVPFVVAAAIVLAGAHLINRGPTSRLAVALTGAGRAVVLGVGACIGAAPFIAANITSRGATFEQTLATAGLLGTHSAAHPGVLGHVLSYAEQVTATLLVGLPHLMGSTLVCVNCPVWPAPHVAVTRLAAVRAAVLSAPFSAVALVCWSVVAWPLVRGGWRWMRSAPRQGDGASAEVSTTEPRAFDARWWGRAMVVLAAAGTLLEYMASTASYATPGVDRYLVGLYVCAPVVVAPLAQAAERLRLWVSRTLAGHRGNNPVWRTTLPLAGLLAVALAFDVVGGGFALRQAGDAQQYGVPAPSRDAGLIRLLSARRITRFYTSYWSCDKLMFEADEQVTCAVVGSDGFRWGYNRVYAYWDLLHHTAHPAYVFDVSGAQQDALDASAHIGALIAARDSRFDGYVQANVDQYRVYYYAGAARGGG